MQAFLQTLHEQYRTEYYGPWHTRECYPWEYDVKAQECIQLASKSDPQFFLPQAKILQDRAAYIRQEWARQEALQAKQTVTQPATQSATQPATQPEHSFKQEEESLQQANAENIAEIVTSSSDTTGLLSTVSHQSIQSSTHSTTQPEHSVEQEEEPLLQANAEKTAENVAEKASDNKATITKNTAQLSTIPRQITTQQAENDTTIWPAISACLGNITLWYITAMTIQEKDLLRRSQPNHYGQLGLCRGTSDDAYLDELKPSDVLLRQSFHYSKVFISAGDFVGCTPLISLASPFISGLRRIMHAYFLP